MFIVTERTPNPDAMKFAPHVRLTDGAAWWFDRRDFDPAASPLAAALFALAGVGRVFVAADFVTVTREPEGPAWEQLRYAVIATLADHIESGQPALTAQALTAQAQAQAQPPAADEIEDEIREVLGRHVRPGVARDGGDVLLDRFDPETGVLWIRMQGACGGCPSSRQTLKAGVENIVRRYVPEVLRVEEVASAATAADPPGSRLRQWAERLGQAPAARPRTVFTRNGQAAAPSGGDAAPALPEKAG